MSEEEFVDRPAPAVRPAKELADQAEAENASDPS